MRVITIKGPVETWEMKFESEKITDSEALHNLLTRVDPGDEYTVTLKNQSETISTGICNCENSFCKHGYEGKMCENTPTDSKHQIIYIGQVCESCYKVYPTEYHESEYFQE